MHGRLRRNKQTGFAFRLDGTQFRVQLAGDTVELQGYFRVADGYFAADHTSFWGCKIG